MVNSLRMLAHNRWFNWAWRFTVTLIVAGWILARLELAEFTRVLIAPRWNALIAMVVAALLFVVLGGLKVWVLLRALAPVRLGAVVQYYFVATAFGSFTPGAVGDFTLAVLLQREQVPIQQGASAMLLDRLITFAAYVLLFVPATAFFVGSVNSWFLFLPASVMLLAWMVWGWLSRRASIRSFVRRHPGLESFMQTFVELIHAHPIHFWGNVGLTLIRSVVAGGGVYLALIAAGQVGALIPVICISNSLSVLSLLPFTLGGVGIYEGSGLVLFEWMGMDREGVLAGLLYQRIYIVVSSLLFMAIYLLLQLIHWRKEQVTFSSSEKNHRRTYE